MQRATTSFQIPNGTVDDYMAAYNRKIVPRRFGKIWRSCFDDNGYSQIIGGLLNMRYVAIILFAAGLLSALAILVLLLYFFIVKTEEAHGNRAEFRYEQKSVPRVACFGRSGL